MQKAQWTEFMRLVTKVIPSPEIETRPYSKMIIHKIAGCSPIQKLTIDREHLTENEISQKSIDILLKEGLELGRKSSPPIAEDYEMFEDDDAEYGGLVCQWKDDSAFIENELSGGMGAAQDMDNASRQCKNSDGRIVALLHSHPFGDLYPSRADLQTAASEGIPLNCISTNIHSGFVQKESEYNVTKEGSEIVCYSISPPGRMLNIFETEKDIAIKQFKRKVVSTHVRYYPNYEDILEIAESEGVDITDDEAVQMFEDDFWSYYEADADVNISEHVVEEDIHKFNELAKERHDTVINAKQECIDAVFWEKKGD